MKHKIRPNIVLITLILSLASYYAASAQTTAFNYNGSLKDAGIAANGTYDFEFVLYDAVAGGNQLGATLPRAAVTVVDGVFSVQLDFGGQFPGAQRFLEIRVRPAGQPGITVLAPRQSVDSAPYSITSANALSLGGVASSQYVLTGDPRLSDPRAPLPGSTNYIRNGAALQTASNFNISGNGTAAGTLTGNIVTAENSFRIGDTRVLAITGGYNTFVGSATGLIVTTGLRNTFVGHGVGASNTEGSDNSFSGATTGTRNTTGSGNSFYGSNAGFENTTASANSYFGDRAGEENIIGADNSFFGSRAGRNNTAGGNSFFGSEAGLSNTTGFRNAYFGNNAGRAGTAARDGAFFGAEAGSQTTGIENSFFGSQSGFGNTSGTRNSFFGLSAGVLNTLGNGNTFYGSFSGLGNTTGDDNTALGSSTSMSGANLSHASVIGAGATVTASNRIQLGRNGSDTVSIGDLAAAGATHVCIVGTVLSSCSSSMRYKDTVRSLTTGLELVRKLRPVTFYWKERHEADLGLIAEEVGAANPLLVTYNKTGAIEGVKYDQIIVFLINAIKQQQEQIETLSRQVRRPGKTPGKNVRRRR